MTLDVNVLVAASRSDHPHHGVALDWLEKAISASPATPSKDAVAFIDALMALPGVCT